MSKTGALFPLGFGLAVFFAVFFVVRAISLSIPLSGTSGATHTVGNYSTGGNAGIISFDDTPVGYSGAEVMGIGGNLYLTGIFWIQTVGWASFSESPVRLIPPPAGSNVREVWYLSGYVWSPNAGWIAMNHGESYASGVTYIPDTRKLVGFGYSPTLGWIPFSVDTGSGVTVGVGDGFIGKLSVSSGIGGDKTFNVLYDVGSSISVTSLSSYLNTIRKNVTILIRNASGRINTDLSGASPASWNRAMVFRTELANQFLTYSDIQTTFDNNRDRSLIVIGADIYIDTDVTTPTLLDQSRVIIALKNAAGEGGNIWIKGSVKEIKSVLFAEKSLISGEEFITGSLSPYYVSKTSLFTDIPRNQLYIRGSIGSYNTIGGSSKDGGAVCPVMNDLGATSCSYDNAIIYDLNYFRIYNGDPARRAYKNSSKDNYSLIVEYDPRTIQDPPPGLETLR